MDESKFDQDFGGDIQGKNFESKLFAYLKHGFNLFTAAAETINSVALDKNLASAKNSEKISSGLETVGTVGGLVVELLGGVGGSAIVRGAGSAGGKLVKMVGRKIEGSKEHVSAKDLHRITARFDPKKSEWYNPVVEALYEIFQCYNLQFQFVLEDEKLEVHLEKAIYKIAKDTVHKIFHGFKQCLEKKPINIPTNFSKNFIIECFQAGDSKGNFIDEKRNKKGFTLFGSVNTQKFFERPLIKEDGFIYGLDLNKPDEKIKAYLYRYPFENEDFKNMKKCKYNKISAWNDMNLEEKDQFNALSRMKKKNIKEFFDMIKSLEEKLMSDILAETQSLHLEPETQKKSESSESESDFDSGLAPEDDKISDDLEDKWRPPNCKVCSSKSSSCIAY